jgi:hypothetical protein
MAQETFILIQRMLLAPQPVLVLQLWMAFPAPILVTLVFLAPEPAFLTQARVANETQFLGRVVGSAPGATECRLAGRCRLGAVLRSSMTVTVICIAGFLFFAAGDQRHDGDRRHGCELE